MYVLTNNEDMIVHISETLDYQKNGNPLVDNGTLAIAKYLVAHTYENIEIPDGVCESKYCYTKDKGFYKNEDYVEPVPEIINQELQEQITELQLAMIELAGAE
ncbi:MAG: hypothetical protein NC483_00480 [Ruminococcus sp.]|nr:hypothetical protein [Ruminococcus sp.]